MKMNLLKFKQTIKCLMKIFQAKKTNYYFYHFTLTITDNRYMSRLYHGLECNECIPRDIMV